MMARKRRGLALAGLILPLLAIAVTRWTTQASGRVYAHSPVRAQTGPQPSQPSQPSQTAPAPIERVRIRVDSARTFEGPAADAASVCGLGQSSPAAAQLGGLDGARLDAASSADQVPVYAARIEDGVALLVVNRADAKAEFDIAVRLGRGVYTAERTLVGQGDQAPPPRVDRLEPTVLGGTGTIGKPGWLNAGELAVYRFVNRSAQTAAAFKGVKDRLRGLRGGRSSEYRRLMAPLSECESNVGALSRGIQPGDRDQPLRHIHRALLTTAHAQSLCRNARGMGRLSGAQAEDIGKALDRLEVSLTELSAGCLQLVPGVLVAPAQDGGSQVTVSLANAGRRTLEVVKLGLTPPPGVSVRPADEALFRGVQPGQTVRAAFTVQLGEQAADRAVIADFSYIAARAPAHLRLKAEVASRVVGDSGQAAPTGAAL